MKIYVNENHEIKAINSTTDMTLKEIEVDRENVFGDMSDFMILNYKYKVYEDGSIGIKPVSNLSKLIEEDYRLRVDEAEKKVDTIERDQSKQDEKILTTMLATTQIFEMMLTLSPPEGVDINIKTLGGNSMIELYATLVIEGAKTIEQVPALIREQVRALVEKLTTVKN